MKKKLFLILCIGTISYSYSGIYDIDILPPVYCDGLFGLSCRAGLLSIINEKKPQVIVELGSFLGGSAIWLAEHTDPSCKIYCVDIWEVGEHWPTGNALQETKSKFFEQFLSNIIHKNLQNRIIPIKMDTVKAAEVLDVKADLIYVDASHWEDDVYNDIRSWYPHLNLNGIMCGDDYLWAHPSVKGFPVKNAVDRAATDLGLKVKTTGEENWFWQFEN